METNYQGYLIKKRAKEQRIRLKKIAGQIGVSRQTICNWINGKRPRGQYLMKLCKILDVSPEYFFKQEEELVFIPRHTFERNWKKPYN